MNIQPGAILISAPLLDDPYFEKVVIVITEYNEKGAIGFVVNQLFERKFNELVEFSQSGPFPLYEGGPMERESLYFIHQKPDLIEEGIPIAGSAYMGGNFKQAVQLLNNKSLAAEDIKLFIGYSGWESGQLEEEMEEGSWLLINASIQHIFSDHTALLWEELYNLYTNH